MFNFCGLYRVFFRLVLRKKSNCCLFVVNLENEICVKKDKDDFISDKGNVL